MQQAVEVLTMRWFKRRELWTIGIASAGVLLLLTCLALLPLSAANAHAETWNVTASGMVTVQATATEDATVTVLNKEQLTQQVAQQQHTWDNWLWSNVATILSSFLSTIVIVIGALFGLWRWRRERQDAQDKELKEHRDAQDKELKERQIELEKRAEERFQSAVTGLGDEKEGAKIGAAILLRTFLRPGYEQFYTQTFDLAVANLRLPRISPLPTDDPDELHSLPQTDPSTPVPLTTLSQALITVLKESFPLARDQLKKETTQFRPQSLVARRIQLDNAYLQEADLKQIWMPQALLRDIDLRGANLSEAHLSEAHLSSANLSEAHLKEANLIYADLQWASLVGTDLSRANLNDANLNRANLIGANLIGASLRSANLSQAKIDWTDLAEYKLGSLIMWAYLRRTYGTGTDLTGADLTGADLSETKIENAHSLKGTDLRRIKGLTKEQLEACKAKGAIIDEDPTSSASQFTVVPSLPPQSNHIQASSNPPAQESTQHPDPNGSNTVSSQQGPKS